MNVLTGFVGAIVEAWDELRIHKVRVLLALVGVAVAVTAITGVTAAVTMLGQAVQEQNDRSVGRSATLQLWTSSMTGQNDPVAVDAAVRSVAARYDISWVSSEIWASTSVQVPGGTLPAETMIVDPAYGVITRQQPTEGRWFVERDVDNLAPVVVVNPAMLEALGVTSLAERPTVVVAGETPVRASVVGVLPPQYTGEGPRMFVLREHVQRWMPDLIVQSGGGGTYKLWVPPDLAEPLADLLRRDVGAALPGSQVDVQPPYTGGTGLEGATRWVILGVGGVALLLGGLGLLNIALVTVRYRIREIGIRRSFGATGSRVFFGVLMESVVATAVAGLVGVVLAVAIVKSIPVERVFGTPLQDTPPFPLDAALLGMACAVGVGALAGLVPAVYAVRVRVIDAIRY